MQINKVQIIICRIKPSCYLIDMLDNNIAKPKGLVQRILGWPYFQVFPPPAQDSTFPTLPRPMKLRL